MGLPKIQQPLFELTIPSTEEKVKFRPFTVKEEKILLIAQESKDFEQVVTSMKQIINNCIEDIDVDELALFDLEYILLKIRSKSVNNIVEFGIRDKETNEEVNLEINLDEIEVHKNPEHSKTVKINNDIVIIMRYPSLDDIKELSEVTDEASRDRALFNVMLNCIDQIVSGDEVYKTSDFTKEEIDDFVDSMSSGDIKKIESFFNTMPVLRVEKEYKRKDGTTKTFVVEGTETFFI